MYKKSDSDDADAISYNDYLNEFNGNWIKETTTVSIPEGLGQVITPTGEIVPATKVIVVPSATGIKTAYPIL